MKIALQYPDEYEALLESDKSRRKSAAQYNKTD
ncbi:hypothetical protein H4W00_000033 [Psychrobacter sp. PL19]